VGTFGKRYKVKFEILYRGVFEESDILGSYDISTGKCLSKVEGQAVKEIPGMDPGDERNMMHRNVGNYVSVDTA
jgi:hypothetical protein